MIDLRSMKKHEMFLSLKRDLALVSLLIGFLLLKIIVALSNYPSFFFKRLFKLRIGPSSW